MSIIDFLNDIVNDLALDGEEGWTLDRLFTTFKSSYRETLLKDLQINIEPNFDDDYMEIVWNVFKTYSQIIYMENDQIIDPNAFTFKGIKHKLGTIKVKAREEIQDINIYGKIQAIKSQLSDTHKLIMHIIAKCRANGITQYDLGQKLNMDSKKIYYYVKKLDRLGLIFKQRAYVSKMSTRLLVLQRFKAENEKLQLNNNGVIYCHSNFDKKIKEKLAGSKDKMMTLMDLIKLVGITEKTKIRWARCRINELAKRKILERFIAHDGKKQKHCVRLVEKEKNIGRTKKVALKKNIKRSRKICRDLPLYQIFYNEVAEAGDKGLIRQDLINKYPSIDPDFFQLFFMKAINLPKNIDLSEYCLYRIEERERKIRRFRYFTLDSWKSFNEKNETPLSDSEYLPIPIPQDILSERLENEVSTDLEEQKSMMDAVKRFKRKYKPGLNKNIALTELQTRCKAASSKLEGTNDRLLPVNNEQSNPILKPSTNSISLNMKRKEPPSEAVYNDLISTSQDSVRSSKRLKKALTSDKNQNALPKVQSKNTNDTINAVNNETSQSSLEESVNVSISNQLKRKSVQLETENIPIPSSSSSSSPPSSQETTSNSNCSNKRFKQDSKGKRSAPFNATKALRHTILLNMLEKDHIRELNNVLALEFHTIENERGTLSNKISRPTLKKMAEELHEQKKLTVYVCSIKQLNGFTATKTFLLHHSLTSESEEVKRYMNDYSFEKCMMHTTLKPKKLKVVNVDEIPTMGESQNKQEQINLRDKIMKMQSNSTHGTWRIIAREYGWIDSKWLRAQEIHETLFEYYEAHERNQVIDLNLFWQTIRLRTIMKIYALLPYSNPILASFLNVESNRNISLNKLPSDIKLIVNQYIPRIRYSAMDSIKVLKELELILIDESNAHRIGIPATVTLCFTGIVKNYTSKDRPEKLRLPLGNKEERQDFWEVLEAYCTQLFTENDVVNDKNDPLYNITAKQTWTSNIELTDNQKSILDSYVDVDAQTIPNENDVGLYSYIKKKTSLTINRIKLYYNSLLVSFDKYNKKKQKQSPKRRYVRKPPSLTIEQLMETSKKDGIIPIIPDELGAQSSCYLVPTFVGSRPFQKIKNYTEIIRPDKYAKDAFSKTEKKLLIHAYAIMKTRGKSSIFRWEPITKIIPNHSAERCRRVISSMQSRDPNFSKSVDKLSSKWLKYYSEGILNNDIKDDKPWEYKNYDLPSFLDYFIKRLADEPPPRASIETNGVSQTSSEEKADSDDSDSNKSNVSKAERFQLVKNKPENKEASKEELRKAARKKREEKSKEICIRKHKKRLEDFTRRYPYPFAVNYEEINSDMPSTASKINPDEIQKRVVMIIIKMIMMTEHNKYKPEDAYLTLRGYPNDIIEKALKTLKDNRIIVNDKTRYGRVPGRHLNVSSKFLDIISGTLPYDHFQNAKEFHNALAVNDTVKIKNSEFNSGSLMTLFELISEGKIQMSIENAAKYLENKNITPIPKRNDAEARRKFFFDNLRLVVEKTDELPAIKDQKFKGKETANCFIPLTSHKIAEYFKANSSEALLKEIFEIVHSFKDRGATFAEILKTAESMMLCSENELMKILEKLLNSSPAMIQLVGLDHLKYITSEFVGEWLIHNKHNKNAAYIRPLMWNELNGNIIQPAIEGLAHTAVSHILDNPGISFTALNSKLEEVCTKYELYHILDYLLKTKRIISRKIIHKGSSGIFTKKSILVTGISNTAMVSNGMTCYWVAPEYYHH
ncbi:uncharacterized protein BX663DRAFT_526537 [Cokeromyces recurvatus]|uniref:uncharacterized protein n=1 Tax=Cokeromyces recurvatus TaxID=90255 RepID=UPI00221F3B27|nr:uncharacterized protein BX663DRAFT_526537 [Cokeromyces recurvatus]KAI7897943.1 hypothetical protein BX663DRAFT_526537 [Cokeromyces recurvatus]